ncbi:threonine synthase [Candidatus Bathyarchaeota archaeon]|nr:threonine synthase [Candidatus Bathyarchaeota archaeon]
MVIPTANVTGLICGSCREEYTTNHDLNSCPKCGGALILNMNLTEMMGKISRDTFSDRGKDIWRYLELLPNIDRDRIVSLGEGGTALLQCRRLSKTLGLRRLFIKDETTNPTGSFLDRGMTVAISRVNQLGYTSLRCMGVSGNFAASASAYASRAGLKCTIHLAKENVKRLDLGKLYQIVAYGGNIRIEGESVDHSETGTPNEKTYTLSPGNPYFAVGEKTTAYELCEQLGWRTPDRIIVPMGHGEHISMIWRGINELRSLDLISGLKVAMTGVQLEEYASLVDLFHGSKSDEKYKGRCKTIAADLAMEKPAYGFLAIESMRESGGTGVKVKDSEVLDAMALLARTEGIFAEPAAASTIAGLKRLIDQGEIDKSEEIVCVVTGSGLKDPSTARRFIRKMKTIDAIVSQIESRRFTTRLGRTKIRILNIIGGRETYGYEIWSVLNERFKAGIDISSVYQHLSDLEKGGLIRRTRVESIMGKPERQYYSLTDKGRNILKSAVEE